MAEHTRRVFNYWRSNPSKRGALWMGWKFGKYGLANTSGQQLFFERRHPRAIGIAVNSDHLELGANAQLGSSFASAFDVDYVLMRVLDLWQRAQAARTKLR